MQPTLRQLEVFLAVARARSFRRAAEGIHLSQPALSQHVGELERGLGARLFDRRGRAVELTEAGRILEEHALRAFSALTGAQEAIADLTGSGRGSLVIGASTTPGIYLMPAVMSALEREQAGISVDLRIANSGAIEERVRANELDLGVVGGHALRSGEECLAEGVLDELVLIVPPGHAWARRARLDPSVLANERLLMREDGSATRQVTERALQHAGIKVGRMLMLDHTEAIKQAVMAGLGVAFVSI
jgi:DNA-binding transcriptional LysR family regulator